MEDEWFGEEYATPKTSAWERWFETRNNRRTFGRILSSGMTSGRMLDIGIGSGSFLAYMKERNWDVLGCDLSKAVCALAEQRWCVSSHCGDVTTLPADAAYDLVVMNHVLEHVQRPVEMLQEVRRRMRPGGLLHLAVPNVACWEAGLPGWTSYEPYHLLYFTPATVRRVVEKAGFRVDGMFTHESFSGWFLAVLRSLLSHRIKSGSQRRTERVRRATSPIEHAYRFAMVASGSVTWPFRCVQEMLGKGDEVIILARV